MEVIKEQQTKELPTDLPKEGQEITPADREREEEESQVENPEFDSMSEYGSERLKDGKTETLSSHGQSMGQDGANT